MKEKYYRILRFLCFAAGLLLSILCFGASRKVQAEALSIKEDISILGIDGKKYSPEAFQEDTVVLIFGRTNCGLTRSMLDTAEKMRKCGASMKIVLMDIDAVDTGMQDYAARHPGILVAHDGGTYTSLMWRLIYEADLYDNSGSITLPALFLMDKERTIIYGSTGLLPDEFRMAAEGPSGVKHQFARIEPTCETAGSINGNCIVCGLKCLEDMITIPAKGHLWDAGTVTVPPSCTRKGTRTFTCTVCKASRKESIRATGHTWGKWVVTVKATAKKEGKQERTCQSCKKKETKILAKTGPAAPVIYYAIPLGFDSTEICWDSIPGVAGYQIDRKINNGKWKKLKILKPQNKFYGESYVDTGLSLGKTYGYRVRAYVKENGKALWGPYNQDDQYLYTETFLNSPTASKIQSSSAHKNTLKWGKADGATSYEIWFRAGSSGSFKKLTTTTKLSYTHKNLKKGTFYYYLVRSCRKVSEKKYYSKFNGVAYVKCK